MIKVKDAAVATAKFVQRAGSAGQDYANGVANAGQLWQTNAAAAEQTWATAVQDAATNDRFRRGVNRAGAAKYTQKASTVGAQRYPSGVQAAGPAWNAGVTPYLTAIGNLTLPPRRPTGDLGNLQRVQVITAALRTLKLQS